MKHHDRDKKIYGKEIIDKNELMFSRLIKFLILLGAMIIGTLMMGCSKKIHASSAQGEALEAMGDYGYVLFRSQSGKADYNTFLQIYFGYPIEKGEKVVVVPQRYLDSLMSSKW